MLLTVFAKTLLGYTLLSINQQLRRGATNPTLIIVANLNSTEFSFKSLIILG